ncbi:MAG: tetratricopeptide repeat protein [Acidobacteria bacterium]|nr:tetratricopeptide repeat protein [Acidobacteriota bacterium]
MLRQAAITVLLLAPLEARWLKLESGPFQVFTDAGERTGRETIDRLDLARRVFAGLSRSRLALPYPVIVFALGSEARFRALRPGDATRGFYQSAPEKDYIVLLAGSMDLGRIVFHEFVHLVLNHTSGPLPQWLEEGLAEFHSTLTADRGRLRLGAPIRSHQRLLAVTPWLSGEDLRAISKNSPHYNEASRTGIFYAQSWALVHMLRLGEGYRDHYGCFLAALENGDSQPAAFQRCFEKSLASAIADLRPYLERTSLPIVESNAGIEPAARDVRLAEISDLDAGMAYAELALEMGQPGEAEKAYGRLSKEHPDSARVAAALGMLALAQKRHQEAKRYLELAMALPGAGADVFFEYGMLLRDTGGGREDVRRYLEKAVAVNPRYAEAHFLLGVAAASENRHRDAIPHLTAAVNVFPRQSYFWHALALSHNALGNTNDARQAAQRALDSASNPEQAAMARGALRLSELPAGTPPAKRPEVTTPESWRNKQGDARAAGVLERIDCLGASARFHVRSGSTSVALFVENPGEVLLKNLSSATFEFRCGPQKPVAVVVRYTLQPDAKLGTAGVVTAIEFR